MNSNKTIGECLELRNNNFNLIRLIAASTVVFSHGFLLGNGNTKSEPLMAFTHGQSTLGHLAVLVFFVISGFLITMSFDKTRDFSYFLKSRVLRIFPALIIVVLLTAFVLGPLVTKLAIADYFTKPETYTYLTTMLLYQWNNNLPGVFNGAPVNGSLWTLQYEFPFYLLVGFLGVCKLLRKKVAILLFLGSFALSFFQDPYQNTQLTWIPDLLRFYTAGMIFYLYRDKIPLNHWMALFAFVVVLASARFGYFNSLFSIFGSYLVIYLSFISVLSINKKLGKNDLSYGIYIYSFPIQEAIATYFRGNAFAPYLNFIIAFPITLIFAYLSWNFIEKKALQYKKVNMNTQQRGILPFRME